MVERSEFTIAPLDGIEACREAAQFQEEIWGAGFSERVPPAILKVSQEIGGVALGAWSGEPMSSELLGFVFGMTGVRSGRLVHWSDMLGVRARARSQGIGVALKEAQRRHARAAGAEVMLWTFDPLEARNAWLNMGRLGATAREYRRDMYGETDSPLHEGIGTDRLLVEWDLGNGGGAGPADQRDLPVVIAEVQGAPRLNEGVSEAHLVPIPNDIQALKSSAPEIARMWRGVVRDALEQAFGQGLAVIGVRRTPDGTSYILDRPGPGIFTREESP